jgi:hypothetical protein
VAINFPRWSRLAFFFLFGHRSVHSSREDSLHSSVGPLLSCSGRPVRCNYAFPNSLSSHAATSSMPCTCDAAGDRRSTFFHDSMSWIFNPFSVMSSARASCMACCASPEVDISVSVNAPFLALRKTRVFTGQQSARTTRPLMTHRLGQFDRQWRTWAGIILGGMAGKFELGSLCESPLGRLGAQLATSRHQSR